jgi:hypothetical protein
MIRGELSRDARLGTPASPRRRIHSGASQNMGARIENLLADFSIGYRGADAPLTLKRSHTDASQIRILVLIEENRQVTRFPRPFSRRGLRGKARRACGFFVQGFLQSLP